jgi:hypothetical protein
VVKAEAQATLRSYSGWAEMVITLICCSDRPRGGDVIGNLIH